MDWRQTETPFCYNEFSKSKRTENIYNVLHPIEEEQQEEEERIAHTHTHTSARKQIQRKAQIVKIGSIEGNLYHIEYNRARSTRLDPIGLAWFGPTRRENQRALRKRCLAISHVYLNWKYVSSKSRKGEPCGTRHLRLWREWDAHTLWEEP